MSKFRKLILSVFVCRFVFFFFFVQIHHLNEIIIIKKQSAADVVIAGLGWVSVTGAGPVTLRVWAPRGVLAMAREPLLPYESWETTAKFTGGATVKKGRKKQGRRA